MCAKPCTEPHRRRLKTLQKLELLPLQHPRLMASWFGELQTAAPAAAAQPGLGWGATAVHVRPAGLLHTTVSAAAYGVRLCLLEAHPCANIAQQRGLKRACSEVTAGQGPSKLSLRMAHRGIRTQSQACLEGLKRGACCAGQHPLEAHFSRHTASSSSLRKQKTVLAGQKEGLVCVGVQ